MCVCVCLSGMLRSGDSAFKLCLSRVSDLVTHSTNKSPSFHLLPSSLCPRSFCFFHTHIHTHADCIPLSLSRHFLLSLAYSHTSSPSVLVAGSRLWTRSPGHLLCLFFSHTCSFSTNTFQLQWKQIPMIHMQKIAYSLTSFYSTHYKNKYNNSNNKLPCVCVFV
jgi:hypothetical protein